jgi:hypothetical protein
LASPQQTVFAFARHRVLGTCADICGTCSGALVPARTSLGFS